MTAGTRMLAGMAVWRAVTAQCSAAFLTCAEMNPACAGLDTLLALPAFRVLDVRNRAEMRTSCARHGCFLLLALLPLLQINELHRSYGQRL